VPVPVPGILKAILLFEGLSPQELAEINSQLHCKTYAHDSNIVLVEQLGEAVYIVVDGTVKVHVEQADGSDVILAILGPGEVVGEMSVVDSLTRSATAATMEESHICWVDRTTFWRWLDEMPIMMRNLVRILSRRIRLANAQIQSLATLDVYGRVARQLLAFANEYGRRAPNGDIVITLRLTQSDLADLIGATRVRVNQVLVDFRQHHYISVDQNHRITVHNREALAQRCE
jgi:CRP/FNR family cyclic AMP-dependent transcriptional regulator